MARRPQTRAELVDTIDDLKPGDHIAMPGQLKVYKHHAIVVEVDLSRRRVTVINYDWDEKGSPTLVRIQEGHYDFDKRRFYKIFYPKDPSLTLYSAEEVIKRAKMYVGELGGFQHGKDSYNVGTNNCEHFATWCKTGRAFCLQLPTEKDLTIAAGATGGAMVGAAIGRLLATAMSGEDENTDEDGKKRKGNQGAKAAGVIIGGVFGALLGGFAGLELAENDSDDEDKTDACAVKQKGHYR